ncbi:hypothetical protein HanPI659440_Chr05g0186521 [Helianthus annuus]|uniref:Uncharacterized protein n=1 Tax=Helianthus annuus TaxID=4232 RepID=A0A251VI00_HELAN|nr:hypothetical protein HanXRQr2_Chr02g0080991 [Helianthus annuus]KAJ0428570.1 hypothetical protein HanHA300_Chr17g0647591 [Helianthus annuus]KAJ0619866.1 hypothetical protein HanHA89_Chr02g0076031 [Helianthus annuus]KAJ0787300.1 hypothetical protein HanOQP8_Chr02g0080941 [Helianthus annuus]KAJ0787993.1 hypothetical protein HanPI659440_Chr05g0186521 [Helianthus annuus]
METLMNAIVKAEYLKHPDEQVKLHMKMKFHNSTTGTLDFVVSESKDTINKLNNVSEILATSKNIGVDQVSLPPSM